MATETTVRIVESSRSGKWVSTKDAASFASPINDVAVDELGLLLKGHKVPGDHRSLVPNRSGSAPPSMEGSFAAFADLINQHNSSRTSSLASLGSALQNCQSEEQLRADPSYIAFYCSNINLNPRLPPPIISRENRHLVRHVGAFSNPCRLRSAEDCFDGSLHLGSSLSTHEEEPDDDTLVQRTLDDQSEISSAVASGQNLVSLAGRHKSLVDLIQEDFPRTPSPVYNQSRCSSHATAEEPTDCNTEALMLDNLSLNIPKLSESKSGSDSSGEVAAGPALATIDDPSVVSLPNKDYIDSLCRSVSPQKEEVANRCSSLGKELLVSGASASAASKSLLTLEDKRSKEERLCDKNVPAQQPHSLQNTLYQVNGTQIQAVGHVVNSIESSFEKFPHVQSRFSSAELQPVPHASGLAPPLYATAAYMSSGNPFYPNLNPTGLYAPQYSVSGYAVGSAFLPSFIAGYPSHSGVPMHFDATSPPSFPAQTSGMSTGESISQVADLQHLSKLYGQHGLMVHPPFPDALHMQYFHHPIEDAFGAASQYVRLPSMGLVGGQVDSYASQKGPMVASYIADHKFQPLPDGSLNVPSPRKMGVPGSSYYGSPTGHGFVPQFPTSPLGSPVLPGSPVAGINPPGRRNENRFSQSSIRNVGLYSGWQGQRGPDSFSDPKKHSLLEELRASNGRKIDLSDIAGRVVELSVDQHGSRFIQQKLENCSMEDKASVFKEVLPHASKLMTDVFGNYVIQKFFEYGSHEQRKELANQLSGQMLPLSLQMYGCRVIQKALEVIELDQKTKLVHELDGHVMRCVRDQNGNHVIQKCIECVSTANIGFIISAFQGQVSTLSTHPYGCRVIQRVLEHCSDDSESQCIVDEILESACDLAQDQYGNYVTQHVLERGRPHERSRIIGKLTGKIVQLSQHKYASNVIEKCLEYGDDAEQELLIEEILEQSDGNDSLLAMMKDQFANYVVQKILEISNDKQREILLNRIRSHLHALKKYTYGKHIVARFEQLSGEESGNSEPLTS